MKIIYHTSGVSGSGRLVRGISICNGFRRRNIECDYIILHSSNFAHLADNFQINQIRIPRENDKELSVDNFFTSTLFQAIKAFNPDILLVDLLWFRLHNFINELPCKKVFLCRQVDESFFSINIPGEVMTFRPTDYDLILAIEPFQNAIPMKSINPIVIRNRDEILSRNEALSRLDLTDSKKICFLSYSGHPGDFEEVGKTYSYLEEEYQMIYTTTYGNGIFPIVDYFNASDLIITGAGYNSFWEIIYFGKEAIIVPTRALFESGERRVNECSNYTFDENGADQLVDIILNL